MTKKTRGLWYEKARKRWRVRLYKDNRVTHLSYHEKESAARRMLERAKTARKTIKPAAAYDLSSPVDQLESLRDGAVR